MHDVAITGLGIVSCLGTNVIQATESLRKGESGIVVDPQREEMGFRSSLTGIIKDFIPLRIERKKIRTMTEFGLQAYAASREAMTMAGWTEETIQNAKTGLIIGNDSSSVAVVQQIDITRREKSTFPIGANLVFQSLNSTVTMNLNALLGIRGASWTISGACASGGHALGQAFDLIRTGRQDRILCGGVQEINWESMASFDATNAFSINMDDPTAASRPFDADRDGLVPSGGAAIVALERMDLARKRSVDIIGRIVSYAFSSDGHHIAVPSGDGLKRCMVDCLQQADLSVERVDVIAAHATSTPLGDAVEARAIHSVFKDHCPHIVAFKSMTGHEMWMAGASQVIYSASMSRAGFIAPTLNFVRQEDDVPKLNISSETINAAPRMVLCNAAGFGGTNSCLLLEVWT